MGYNPRLLRAPSLDSKENGVTTTDDSCDVTFLFGYDTLMMERENNKAMGKGTAVPSTSIYDTLGLPPLDREAYVELPAVNDARNRRGIRPLGRLIYEEMLAIATKTINGYADSITSRG